MLPASVGPVHTETKRLRRSTGSALRQNTSPVWRFIATMFSSRSTMNSASPEMAGVEALPIFCSQRRSPLLSATAMVRPDTPVA